MPGLFNSGPRCTSIRIFNMYISKSFTLYPYLAINLAAKPNPADGGRGFSGPIMAVADDDDGGGGEDVFDVSVREGGGAIAAPPEVAVEKQSQLVEFKNDANIPIYVVGKRRRAETEAVSQEEFGF